MSDWMTIRVVLAEQADVPLDDPPGRVFLAHPEHAFADLAEAIDTAFGRWDLTPLHSFEVDDRVLLSAGAELEDDAEESDELTLGEAGLGLGTRFTYVFDIGEGWTHECSVEEVDVEVLDSDEDGPDVPVPVFGWGSIPDQYGRLTEDDEDEPFDEDEVVEVELFDDEDEVADGDDEPFDEDEDADGDDDAERRASWEVVAGALPDLDAEPEPAALRRAVAALRAGDEGEEPGANVLWAAAGMEPGEAPEDDEELWTRLAAAVVVPQGPVPLDAATVEAWAALEPADWAGAVIELIRSGEGTVASPEAMIELIERCPEIEGEELEEEEEAVILAGLEVAVALWRALGALDEEGALTPFGTWGLPRSLQRAWTG